tara:strand:+ start:181 stop:528 length:348 start_codon:yes stop_codon:yes gene_type:complete
MTKHASMLQAYRILMPYCFEPDEDNGYLLTGYNRDYATIPRARILFKSSPSRFKGVWFRDDSTDGAPYFYMYNDDPSSRKDYWERLGKLFSHKHVVVGDPIIPINRAALRGSYAI